MDKQFKDEERILKDLISGAGLEKPTQGFKSNVMDLVDQKASERVQYKPLIGKKVWMLIAASFITILVIVYLYPSKPFEKLGVSFSLDNFDGIIPDLAVSNTSVYGMLFLSLFLFQIPFLKKYLERANF